MMCMNSPFIWLSWEGRSSQKRDGKNLLKKWESVWKIRFPSSMYLSIISYLLYLEWLPFYLKERNSNTVNLEIWSTTKIPFCMIHKEVFLLFRLKILWSQHWIRSQLIMWNFTGNLKSISCFFFVLTASVSKLSHFLMCCFEHAV